ncbi:MAG: DUF5985 family protein [Bdellovibrionales bacterium]
MAGIVYLLCALTSLGCAGVLMRAYRNSRSNLLLWSSVCFIGLAANNVLLLVDLLIGPAYDLTAFRAYLALAGMGVLIYGLVWDTV